MGVFVVNFHVFGAGPILVPKLVLSCAMIVLFAIDLEHHLLPNVITLPGIVAGFFLACFRQARWRRRSAFWSAADRSGSLARRTIATQGRKAWAGATSRCSR
jgi:prepilin signal peptidase PulO-like enzyme (type II secretory pathway)